MPPRPRCATAMAARRSCPPATWLAATGGTAASAAWPARSGRGAGLHTRPVAGLDRGRAVFDPGGVSSFAAERGALFFPPPAAPPRGGALAIRPPADRTPPDTPVVLDEVQALAST